MKRKKASFLSRASWGQLSGPQVSHRKGSVIPFRQAHVMWHMKGDMAAVFSKHNFSCLAKYNFKFLFFPFCLTEVEDQASYTECAYVNESVDIGHF